MAGIWGFLFLFCFYLSAFGLYDFMTHNNEDMYWMTCDDQHLDKIAPPPVLARAYLVIHF